MFQITYSKKAEKFLRKQDKTTQYRLFTAISKLPLEGNIKNYKVSPAIDFVLEITEYYSMSMDSLLIS